MAAFTADEKTNQFTNIFIYFWPINSHLKSAPRERRTSALPDGAMQGCICISNLYFLHFRIQFVQNIILDYNDRTIVGLCILQTNKQRHQANSRLKSFDLNHVWRCPGVSATKVHFYVEILKIWYFEECKKLHMWYYLRGCTQHKGALNTSMLKLTKMSIVQWHEMGCTSFTVRVFRLASGHITPFYLAKIGISFMISQTLVESSRLPPRCLSVAALRSKVATEAVLILHQATKNLLEKRLAKCQSRDVFCPSSTHIHVRVWDFIWNLFCYKL